MIRHRPKRAIIGLDPAINKELTDQGAIVVGSESPEAFSAFVKHNVEMWGKVLKEADFEQL